jgi:23S rRNA (cytosine1962-C5)-methyltransferase
MLSQPVITTAPFTDFQLLDSGAGYRLEQWGEYRLARPDPQVIWNRHLKIDEWNAADVTYEGAGEKGQWKLRTRVPGSWMVKYAPSYLPKPLQFHARLTPFKHTGIFAEQAANWEWMARMAGKSPRKILNLFGYTGAASIILSALGHQVTHVDASKPSIGWAKQNQELNGLPPDGIRWILDDAAKFVAREIKRGQTYDGIVMDPPAFGHSPTGKTWKFNKDLPSLLRDCERILSPDADFLLVNGYATNSSAIALSNVVEDCVQRIRGGTVEQGELCLQQTDGRLLSTGILARWSKSSV